jgi:hypothetical protein
LLSEDDPVVHVEVDQRTGRLVESDETLQTGQLSRARWLHGNETKLIDNSHEGFATHRIDEQIEVGLATQGCSEMLVALPMDEPNVGSVETLKDGVRELEHFAGSHAEPAR